MSLHEDIKQATMQMYATPAALAQIATRRDTQPLLQESINLDVSIFTIPQTPNYVAMTVLDTSDGTLVASPVLAIERHDLHDRLRLKLRSLRGAEPALVAQLAKFDIDILADVAVRDALDCTQDMHLKAQLDMRASCPCRATLTQCTQRAIDGPHPWHDPLSQPWLPRMCKLYKQ